MRIFLNGPDSHRYVPLPSNQIIEGWQSSLRRGYVSWWIHFFKDFCDQRTIDLTNQLERLFALEDYFTFKTEGALAHSLYLRLNT